MRFKFTQQCAPRYYLGIGWLNVMWWPDDKHFLEVRVDWPWKRKKMAPTKRVLICCWDCKKHLGCRGVATKPTQCIDYAQQPKPLGPERPPDRHWYRIDKA